jgi:hypothetical protein
MGKGRHRFVKRQAKQAIALTKAVGNPVGDFHKLAAPSAIDKVPPEVAHHPAGQVGSLGDRRGQRWNIGQHQTDPILSQECDF